jgi:hypothetical protein
MSHFNSLLVGNNGNNENLKFRMKLMWIVVTYFSSLILVIFTRKLSLEINLESCQRGPTNNYPKYQFHNQKT